MIFIFEETGKIDSNTFSSQSLFDAASYLGVECIKWDRRAINCIDLIDRVNPDIIFTASELTKGQYALCNDKGIRVVNIYSLPFIPNILLYNVQIRPEPITQGTNLALLLFPDKDCESVTGVEPRSIVTMNPRLHLFSTFLVAHSYGNLGPHSVVASCCLTSASVVTTSRETAKLLSLVNNNVHMIEKYGNAYSINRVNLLEEAVRSSNIIAIADYLPIGTDYEKAKLEVLSPYISKEG